MTRARRDLERLTDRLAGKRLAVLTGAGISTESGIPDYRGPLTRDRPRPRVQYRPFVDHPSVRARYWARSAIGWPRFRAFQPNAAHLALTRLEDARLLSGLITQNVDRLHSKAGQDRVIELHGALAKVRCLGCDLRSDRDGLQVRLLELNPAFRPEAFPLAPDGDADVPEESVAAFRVPGCAACGGVLKPDVVFFGESVPPPRVAQAFSLLDAAEALLIVGSSLAIHSGFRFLARARARGLPVALINLGDCRGREQIEIHLDAPAGEALPALVERLLAAGQPASQELTGASSPCGVG